MATCELPSNANMSAAAAGPAVAVEVVSGPEVRAAAWAAAAVGKHSPLVSTQLWHHEFSQFNKEESV